jgi:hypothetical protein
MKMVGQHYHKSLGEAAAAPAKQAAANDGGSKSASTASEEEQQGTGIGRANAIAVHFARIAGGEQRSGRGG